jgi:hypothetical protein
MTPPPVDRRLQLQIIFAFMAIYALLLFLSRREPNTGQIVFRVTMAMIGVVGFGVVSRSRSE